MPRVRYGNREYFVDERLREFRSASYPPESIEFVPFESAKGGRMWATLLSGNKTPLRENPPTQRGTPNIAFFRGDVRELRT